MQQVYRRIHMSKCGFRDVAKQHYWNTLQHTWFHVNLQHISGIPIFKNSSGEPLLFFYFYWTNRTSIYFNDFNQKRNYKLLVIQKLFILKITHSLILWRSTLKYFDFNVNTSSLCFLRHFLVIWNFFHINITHNISVWLEISFSFSLITQSSFTFGGSKTNFTLVP